MFPIDVLVRLQLFWSLLRSLINQIWRFVRSRSLPVTCRFDMESDDNCEWDSTWEDEDTTKISKEREWDPSNWASNRSRRMYAAKDMQAYRHRVRDVDNVKDDDDDDDDEEDDEEDLYNLRFYQGQRRSVPDDVHIHDFHKEWHADYNRLERVHSYIQWLFPLQEPGMNWDAHVLTKKEIKLFREDENAKNNLVKSYKLMLDFYGIELVNESTGEVTHAPNWQDRFRNLNRNTHNNLRITRILKSLGTLGFQHYQAPLVKFFLKVTLVDGHLERVKQSVLDYFMFAVLDKLKRRDLIRYAFKHFESQDKFVWGPKKILSGDVSKHGENETDKFTTENECTPSEENSNHNSILDAKEISHGEQLSSKDSTCISSTSNPAEEAEETPKSELEKSSDSKHEVTQKVHPSEGMESGEHAAKNTDETMFV
ncbi:opioid growth factor receptor-like protein 1 [Xyrauchen texanus]|uniref:opioid growth factor receptor-like protein 1 n=1 Tax=Xyrauchen texanus TaxID=154827 RepID=UPI002242A83A|nr:opioid growth factor receptor-like protein 1 [Xyrauchen texanus]